MVSGWKSNCHIGRPKFYPIDGEIMDGLRLEQETLESEGIWQGILRYRKEKGITDLSHMPPGQSLLAEYVPKVALGIEKLQRDVVGGNSGPNMRKWGVPLLMLDADHWAAICLVLCINHAANAKTLNIALDISNQGYLEYKWAVLRRTAPGLVHVASQKTKKWDARKARRLTKWAGEFQKGYWPKQVRIQVGMALIKVLLESTDLFEIGKETRQGKTTGVLRFTQKAWDTVEELHKGAEQWRPLLPPMVCEPLPWDHKGNGGYLKIYQPLIKPNGSGSFNSYVLPNAPCLDALNTLQRTRWRVNKRLYQYMVEIWDSGGVVGDLPPKFNQPIPERPKDIDTNAEARKEWRRLASRVHDTNNRNTSRRLSVTLKLRVAKNMLDRVFYIPHNFDWRGRMYPLTNHLHPQAEDSTKALLEFADGQPLTSEGYDWLRIHVANCWGEDKVSMQERILWVEKFSKMIYACASDPITNREWEEADDPWCFLAACMALKDYKDDSSTPIHLPVSIDGTCNGLQHYAALGLDSKGGLAVNLVPTKQPSDLYTEVCNGVCAIVKRDALKGVDEAKNWDGYVTRKVVKRAAMTYAYGVTYYGVGNQLIEDGHCDGLNGSLRDNALYLTSVILEVIPKVVEAADSYMDWLQRAASVVAAAGKFLCWTTPSGFCPVQHYVSMKERRVVTLLQTVTVLEPKKKDPLDKRKQRTTVPPNFIHSYDAAHMALVINEASKKGVKNFMMIHDSYGSHPNDMGTLSSCTREKFAEIYKEEVLSRFKAEVERRTCMKLPDLPPQGDLDISKVLESKYFFN